MAANKRQLNDDFLKAFTEGELKPLLDAVRHDDTLDFELRGKAVNIYYRGGSLFRISERKRGLPKIEFNISYCLDPANKLAANPDPDAAARNIPFYKQAIDHYFHVHPQYEREFQQVIARENNNHKKISNGTDYYIADIEYVEGKARFDMVALKWLSEGAVRKNKNKASLALIEVKYGDGALKGAAGMEKHLDDFQSFLSSNELEVFCDDMTEVFQQRCKLGLVSGLREEQYGVQISHLDPEVIFIVANHDPASETLEGILKSIDLTKYSFPILIAKASNMGYCLYRNMFERINP